jgi:hypothetical protein
MKFNNLASSENAQLLINTSTIIRDITDDAGNKEQTVFLLRN